MIRNRIQYEFSKEDLPKMTPKMIADLYNAGLHQMNNSNSLLGYNPNRDYHVELDDLPTCHRWTITFNTITPLADSKYYTLLAGIARTLEKLNITPIGLSWGPIEQEAQHATS